MKYQVSGTRETWIHTLRNLLGSVTLAKLLNPFKASVVLFVKNLLHIAFG